MHGVVVVAGGSGTRLGSDLAKALVRLGDRTLVEHAVALLADAGLPPPVVVHPAGMREEFAATLARHDVAALVPGGVTRAASVRAGVAALGADAHLVVVHDAARPLVPASVVASTVEAVAGDVLAAAPGIAVADTVKRVDGNRILGTVDRTGLVTIQTPQVFRREVIEHVLAEEVDATDELALVERAVLAGQLDGEVVVVDGSVWGMKVTTRQDLDIANALLGAR